MVFRNTIYWQLFIISMKRFIFSVLISFTTWHLYAQEPSLVDGINYEQLERYIQLAKENYPRRKMLKINEQKANSIYKASPLGYLDLLDVSYFYRPSERTAINQENPFVVNGFQFGLHLNLATFLQRPSEIKQAKADYQIAMLESQEYEKTLENEVKRRYYLYVRLLEDLKIKTQTSQDNKLLLEDLQYKFERGEVELESYSTVKTNLSTSRSDMLEAEMNVLVSKDALEELIGTKLSDVK